MVSWRRFESDCVEGVLNHIRAPTKEAPLLSLALHKLDLFLL